MYKIDIKENDIVKVEGIVRYGNLSYEVNCIGIVQDVRTKSMLITLDEVDRDRKVNCVVKKKYITPLSIIDIGNNLTGQNFETKEEFLNYLSNEFNSKLEETEDAQDAFNNLDDDYSNYLSSIGCVYSLFDGQDWEINVDDNIFNTCSLETFQNVLNDNSLKTIDNIASKLTSNVMNIMSNVGCDVFNALKLQLDDFDENLEDLIIVYSNGDGPKIELVDDLLI